jgi:hypothetical protein
MKRLASAALLALLAFGSGGCVSVYTSIHKVDDNTYYLTRVRNARSWVYSCTPIGQSADLRCTEIASPD